MDKSSIIVDLEFEPFVKDKNWYVNTHGNLMCKLYGKNIYLAHIVLRRSFDKFDVDHIDRNVYNNKEKNLRVVTRSANLLNHGRRNIVINGPSFMVYVGRGNYVGRRKTYEEAAKLYDKTHLEVFRKELLTTRNQNLHLTDEEYFYYLCPTF